MMARLSPARDKASKPIARTLISSPSLPATDLMSVEHEGFSPFFLTAGLGPCRYLLLLVLVRTEIKER